MDDEGEAFHALVDYRDTAGQGTGCEDGDLARKHGGSEAGLYSWKAKSSVGWPSRAPSA